MLSKITIEDADKHGFVSEYAHEILGLFSYVIKTRSNLA
jgi:hypothetical protein